MTLRTPGCTAPGVPGAPVGATGPMRSLVPDGPGMGTACTLMDSLLEDSR